MSAAEHVSSLRAYKFEEEELHLQTWSFLTIFILCIIYGMCSPKGFTLSKQFEQGLDEKLIVNVWSRNFRTLHRIGKFIVIYTIDGQLSPTSAS
jgi:hypothetical protein